MLQIEKVYEALTGVDIEEQKRLWDERGKGYYGEYLVFCELYKNIPGVCKILMNLKIPASFGKSTEIDLLMVHETGIYVFEVKHFKGTIYGQTSDSHWTQYFRTSSNHSFKNPIKQNQYHVENVKRMFPDIPVYSFIVFTSDDCDLKVEGVLPNTSICVLYDLNYEFRYVREKKVSFLTLNQIDNIFNKLKPFSPLENKTVIIDGQVVPFYQYVEAILKDFQDSLCVLESKYAEIVEKNKALYRSKVRKVLCGALAGCFLTALGCANIAHRSQNEALEANTKLSEFAQKFEYVEEFNSGDIRVKKDMVLVSDVLLEQSSDFDNVVNFSCSLTWNGGNYSVSIGEDAKIIVFLNDGSIQEYDLWNKTYPFSSTFLLGYSNFYLTRKIELHEFYDISVSDIAYIKLSNLGLRRRDTYSREDCLSGYEIELYNKEKLDR